MADSNVEDDEDKSQSLDEDEKRELQDKEDYASDFLPIDPEEPAKSFDESSWKVDTDPVQHIPAFVGISGPSIYLKEDELENPLHYFNLFIRSWMWINFAKSANKKAQMEKKTEKVR